jgi:predicted nuclease of predicted toxin-antitoxin system
VKLLFDENLSPRLVAALADVYPGSAHVHECGLGSADDIAIWQYAKDNDFTIVSKDPDFQERSILQGYPPKIIWVRATNCTAQKSRISCALPCRWLRGLRKKPKNRVWSSRFAVRRGNTPTVGHNMLWGRGGGSSSH